MSGRRLVIAPIQIAAVERDVLRLRDRERNFDAVGALAGDASVAPLDGTDRQGEPAASADRRNLEALPRELPALVGIGLAIVIVEGKTARCLTGQDQEGQARIGRRRYR